MSPRKALVTGGGGAMAREIAQRLERQGYRLVLVDVDEERMAANAELLRSPDTRVADLSSPEQIRTVADWIEDEHADLDLLVNNAGLIQPGDIDEVTAADIDRHVNVNLLAPMHLTRAAARVMKPRRRGDILTIVSMGGILALPGSASYAASKFGLRGFQTSIRSELAPHGVRVMGVFPSGVDTPMLRYEATHGGSALNFVGKVKTVADVGDAVEKALRTGNLETYVPYGDSLTTRVFGSIPWAIEKVVPMFTRSGEKGRAAFIAERGL
jgi:NAD(P)-dependent dehydrogenase (short-subunit alcohol dehydrogenase family)